MTETLTPIPMDPAIRDAWTAVLRSGEYRQAQGSLRTEGGYCCLGVLCDIAPDALGTWNKLSYASPERIDVLDYEGNPTGETHSASHDTSLPPFRIREWSGLDWDAVSFGELVWRDEDGDSYDTGDSATLPVLNDDMGATFEQIADLIDGHAVVLGDFTYQYDPESSFGITAEAA